MSAGAYMGLPEHDIAAQLRHHAAQLSDGVRPRPQRALLVEFHNDGPPTLVTLGPNYGSYREALTALLDCASAINAEASN